MSLRGEPSGAAPGDVSMLQLLLVSEGESEGPGHALSAS